MCWVAIATAMGASATTAATVGTVASVAVPVASTMIQMDAQSKAGQAAKQQGDQTAREIERDNRMAKVEAQQKSRDMIQSYAEDSNSNSAFFSYLGIESSESIKAFEQKQESIILEDERRMKTQGALRSSRAGLEAATSRRAGANALAASQIDVVTTGLNAYSNIKKVTPKIKLKDLTG